MNENELFFPGLDEHSGGVPSLQDKVHVDHALMVACKNMDGGSQVYYRDPLTPELKSILPPRVIGNRLNGTIGNGDFIWKISEVRRGRAKPIRVLPPGAHGKRELGPVAKLLASRKSAVNIQ